MKHNGIEHGKLIGMGQQTIAEMKLQEKVNELSFKQTAEIDDTLAKGLAPIQAKSARKQRACRAYNNSKGI